MKVTGWAEYAGGTICRFHCPHGHTMDLDTAGPQVSPEKHLTPEQTERMIEWLVAKHDGVAFDCPDCGPGPVGAA